MAIEVAKYQFQSWVRKGISDPDQRAGLRSATPPRPLPPDERASVPIGVSINADAASIRSLRADRPGRHHRHPPRHGRAHRAAQRIIELRSRTISRSSSSTTRTSPGVTRPARPDGDTLRPWILLLVLKEDEFVRDDRRAAAAGRHGQEQGGAAARRTRPGCSRTRISNRPFRPSELSDLERYLKSLQEALPPTRTRSTAGCCRRGISTPNTAYHAFLVPGLRSRATCRPAANPPRACRHRSRRGMRSAGVELPFYFDW